MFRVFSVDPNVPKHSKKHFGISKFPPPKKIVKKRFLITALSRGPGLGRWPAGPGARAGPRGPSRGPVPGVWGAGPGALGPGPRAKAPDPGPRSGSPVPGPLSLGGLVSLSTTYMWEFTGSLECPADPSPLRPFWGFGRKIGPDVTRPAHWQGHITCWTGIRDVSTKVHLRDPATCVLSLQLRTRRTPRIVGVGASACLDPFGSIPLLPV